MRKKSSIISHLVDHEKIELDKHIEDIVLRNQSSRGGGGGGQSVDTSRLEPSITHSITFTLPATANSKAWLEVPWDCTITDWTITTDASGSCVLDLWNDTYGNYPPTVADTITASAKPTLTTAQKATSATLTGWDTALSAGDYLLCNVDSASGATIIYLTLSVIRT